MIFSWAFLSRPAGSSVRLAHGGGSVTYFVPDLPGVYEVHLTVDQDIAPGLATVTLTVAPAEPGHTSQGPEILRQLSAQEDMTYPTAAVEFTPSRPSVGSLVELDGSKSTASVPDYPLFFDWQMVSRPSGSRAALDSRSDPATTFVPDVPGDYTIFFSAMHDSSQAMILGTIQVR